MSNDDEPFLAIGGVRIESAADLLFAYANLAHGREFIEPLICTQERRCCRCGAVIDRDNPGWVSFQTLQYEGVLSGFAWLNHCRDCPPATLLSEIRAVGTWPSETDGWKITQGTNDP